MNTQSNQSFKLLEQAEHAMRSASIPDGPRQAVVDSILSQIKQDMVVTRPRSTWFTPAKSIAAILAVAASVAFVVLQFPSNTFALTDLTQAIRKAKTLTYTVVSSNKDNQDPLKPKQTSQWKMLYKDPGRTRTEHQDGMVSVTDVSKHRLLTLQPATKTATSMDLPKLDSNAGNLQFNMTEFPINVLEQGASSGKDLGSKSIQGKLVHGFAVQSGPVAMNVWGDPSTQLPIEIEYEVKVGQDVYQITMQDFQFGIDLNDELFSTDIPEGYTNTKDSFPHVDYGKTRLPPETHVVKILQQHASRFDGKFPSQIDDPGLIATFVQSYGSSIDEAKKALAELTPSLGESWTYRTTLNRFGYTGDAKLGDKNKIVFWYLPKDAKKYRVVMADLSIQDVEEDQIPKKLP